MLEKIFYLIYILLLIISEFILFQLTIGFAFKNRTFLQKLQQIGIALIFIPIVLTVIGLDIAIEIRTVWIDSRTNKRLNK
ncbi:MAG: hypothetical protein ACFFDF_08680 [Candidatus Odinarchaeota archaeon]